MDMPYFPRTNGPNTSLLMQLLRLPSLENLYFKDGVHEYNDETPYEELLPARSSSLKHIFMDNSTELGFTFEKAFAQAPKALLSASFRAGPARLENADSLVKALGVHQGETLESLMFYGYSYSNSTSGGINGYRCGAFRPEELDGFQVLRQLCVNVQDVELDANYQDDCRQDWESDGGWLERFFVSTFQGLPSLEALVLWNGLTSGYISWEPTEEQGFEDALAWLMNSDGAEDPIVYCRRCISKMWRDVVDILPHAVRVPHHRRKITFGFAALWKLDGSAVLMFIQLLIRIHRGMKRRFPRRRTSTTGRLGRGARDRVTGCSIYMRGEGGREDVGSVGIVRVVWRCIRRSFGMGLRKRRGGLERMARMLEWRIYEVVGKREKKKKNRRRRRSSKD
jgi:hypothetical protein